jgi:hypothetical protein
LNSHKESHGSEWDERGITQAFLQQWLRKNHQIRISVMFSPHELQYEFYLHYHILDERITQESPWFKTYEIALEAALKDALKLI